VSGTHFRFDTCKFEGAKLQNNVKRTISIVLTLSLIVLTLTSAGPGRHRRDNYKIKTIVIDAGHGGHDTGCLGASAREKNVALGIALKFGRLIEQNFPDVKVIYTRKTDVFIPLHERANIANRNKADLFVCIHLNSGNKAAYGAETYVMGLHKSEDNLNVAKRENASILLEDDYKTQYDGFDPNSPEANIIFSLYQNQFMHQSLSFASSIQEQFEDFAGRYNRGVKQAGFLVLYKTAMPSVLVECGFLTHDAEENYVAADKGQNTIANSIFRAFKEYKLDMENGSPEEKSNVVQTPPTEDSIEVPIQKKEEQEEKKEPKPAVEPIKPQVKQEVKQEAKPEVKPAPKQAIKSKPEPVTAPSPKPKKVIAKDEAPANDGASSADNVFIAIQVGASKNPEADNAKFLKTKGVSGIRCNDGFTRYAIGSFSQIADAKKKLAQVKSAGFKDAFLTAFKGDQRITVPEAEQLIKSK
jgi:N-acetylmuramoyl-L-alanine amidase